MKRFVCLSFIAYCLLIPSFAHAEVSIETSVSKSSVAVGEDFKLDIIILNAEGPISRPVMPTLEGLSSYSQGSTQEMSWYNGAKSSRSIFSYVFVPNTEGKKSIGPFEVQIGGKTFKAPAVEVQVVAESAASPQTSSSAGPFSSLPARPSPSNANAISSDDVFVRALLDKDEAFVNEPVLLTYTMYQRVPAAFKGFEKEPVSTGFWVEDFPPERNPQRTQQNINGSTYLATDVRHMDLFPTEAGDFSIDAGKVVAHVELRNDDPFNRFQSVGAFGGRQIMFSPVLVQVVPKSMDAGTVKLKVKPLPTEGRPASFTGAVGRYQIEGSVDKTEVEQGTPVTYRIRISGQGNINTLQTPSFKGLDDFKVYDSSNSVNVNKNRMMVEGEKVVDTVLVPKKSGTLTIAPLKFSYFDPKLMTYKELQTAPQTITVKPSSEASSSDRENYSTRPAEPAAKEEVQVVGQDIRFIKATPEKTFWPKGVFYKNPLYWVLCGVLLALAVLLGIFGRLRQNGGSDSGGFRMRQSSRLARSKLRAAQNFLKKNEHDAFYSEISKAVYGYFSDKLNIPVTRVDVETISAALDGAEHHHEILKEVRDFFDELHYGQFGIVEKDGEKMKKVYAMAQKLIDTFEKVKRK